MEVKVEKLEKNEVKLDVTVPADRVDKALAEAYRQVVRKVSIPGFRKGHVPKKIIEMHYGKGVLYEEALDILLPEVYSQAIAKADIEPIDQPRIDKIDIEEGKPCHFSAVVEVKPEVALGQYKGLVIGKEKVVVEEEEVEEHLKGLRERAAIWKNVEGDAVAQDGDMAVIDFTGYIDDEPLEGGQGENYPLTLGSGSFIPGFEEQVIGGKVGEEREIEVTFPEDYHNTEIAGAEAKFKVKIKEIKRKELPSLDDEFAKDLGEFDTLAELRQDVKETLTENARVRAEEEFRGEVIRQVVENAEVEVPPVLIDRRLESAMQDFERRLQQQGVSLDIYLEYSKKTLEEIKKDFQPDVAKSVKTELVLDAIAKAENIEASAEEVEAELTKLAGSIHEEEAKAEEFKQNLRKLGHVEVLAGEIIRNKTLDLLIEKVVEPSGLES